MILPPNSGNQVPDLLTPLADIFIRWKQLGGGDYDNKDGREDRLKEEACQSVWLLRRFYQEATKDDFAEGLLRQFTILFPSGPKTARFFIAWINLIETLCQGAERQYGSKSGQGAYKAQQVKAVMLHLIFEGEDFDIPGIPNFLEPLVAEIVIDISVDMVVKMLNRDKDVLWQPAPIGPIPRRQIFAIIFSKLWAFGQWLMRLAPVARLGEKVRELSRWALLKANPLPRKTEDEVRAILREQPDLADVLHRVEQVIQWLMQHKENVVALIELVSVAVQDAERFMELPGPDKKIYARNMVICFLQDYDIIQSDIALQITEWILDWAIDSVVDIFNKRGAFQRSGVATT